MDTHHLRKQRFLSQWVCSFPSGKEQTRRFIHEAEDFAVFSPRVYKHHPYDFLEEGSGGGL